MALEKKETIAKEQPYSNEVVSLITTEIQDFEENSINLSDNVTFNQHQTVQNTLTHQNKGFLTSLAEGQTDDREFYDIVSPMIETAVVNCDLDAENIEAYTDNIEYLVHEYFAKCILKNYLKQTNHGIVLNEIIYQYFDDGNLLVRRVNEDGEFYRPVLPQNIYIVDQSAKTTEDTTVIEKDVMNQTQLRSQKVWENTQRVIDYCNIGKNQIPYYEIFYRYGELPKSKVKLLKKEIHGTDSKEEDGDDNYVQSLVVMAKPKAGVKDKDTDTDIHGVIVFVEELKPETFKVTSKISVTRYKPYEFVRLGNFKGRFWGMGYREIGLPYQNRANELGNQIREIMKTAIKTVFWSTDKKIAGKNILSSIKNGQILKADHLAILNNVFPNLSLFAEEWNRNLAECEKALKAFEVASGEALPSSTSATGIAVQNQAVGRYYNFKRERLGLFLGTVFKRWVIPDLLKHTTPDEAIKIVGDASFVEKIVDAYLNGWFAVNVLKMAALSGKTISPQEAEQILAIKKEELLKQENLYLLAFEDFFKDVEMFVGINATGELWNKNTAIQNRLALLAQTPPEFIADEVNDIREMLGIKPFPRPSLNNTTYTDQASSTPAKAGTNIPMREQSASQTALQENGNVATL